MPATDAPGPPSMTTVVYLPPRAAVKPQTQDMWVGRIHKPNMWAPCLCISLGNACAYMAQTMCSAWGKMRCIERRAHGRTFEGLPMLDLLAQLIGKPVEACDDGLAPLLADTRAF